MISAKYANILTREGLKNNNSVLYAEIDRCITHAANEGQNSVSVYKTSYSPYFNFIKNITKELQSHGYVVSLHTEETQGCKTSDFYTISWNNQE